MATASEIIRRSLLLIGELEEDETPSSTQSADGLSALQEMMESWSAEGLMIPYITTENYTLTTGQASYTYGTGGDFNAARPMSIEDAYLRDSNGDDSPIQIIDRDRYNEITDKDLSGEPSDLYYVPSYATGTVYLNRAPDAAYTLYMDVLKELTTPTALTDSLSFPPGYTRAIRYNLAIEIAPEYAAPIPDAVALIARRSKNTLETRNIRVPMMESDVPSSGGRFNIYTGE